MCPRTYEGVRNIDFLENFAFVLNEEFLNDFMVNLELSSLRTMFQTHPPDYGESSN